LGVPLGMDDGLVAVDDDLGRFSLLDVVGTQYNLGSVGQFTTVSSGQHPVGGDQRAT